LLNKEFNMKTKTLDEILDIKTQVDTIQGRIDSISSNIKIFIDNHIDIPNDYIDNLDKLNQDLDDIKDENPEYFI